MDGSLLDFQSVCLLSAWKRVAKTLLAGFRKPAELMNGVEAGGWVALP